MVSVRLTHGFFKKSPATYHVDLSQPGRFYQVNLSTKYKRPVRRRIVGGGGGGGVRGGVGGGIGGGFAAPAPAGMPAFAPPRGPSPTGVFWSWRDDSGWKQYDPATSAAIESAYQRGDTKHELRSSAYFTARPFYRVDLSAKFQQVNARTGYKRQVRRQDGAKTIYKSTKTRPAPTPGGAGFLSSLYSWISPGGGAASPMPPKGPATVTPTGVFWSWRDDSGWKQYDPATSAAIESAYQRGDTKHELRSSAYFTARPFYRVDLSAKFQQVNARTGYKRQVRRQDGATVTYNPTTTKMTTATPAGAPKVVPGPKAAVSSPPGGMPVYVHEPASVVPSVVAGDPLVLSGKAYRLGPAAARPPPRALNAQPGKLDQPEATLAKMLQESVKNVSTMRGQRGQLTVTQMLQRAYRNGLFMHGGPSSPVNALVVPALRFAVWWCSERRAGDPKRDHILRTLANACLDCQQVQAREILRLYRELTNQAQTLPLQIGGFLDAFRESAIQAMISARHAPLCDMDHTRAKPGQQRPHLRSAYVAIAGDAMGMRDTLPAKNDRFLYDAQSEIARSMGAKPDPSGLARALMSSISTKLFFQGLLSDINNQSPSADRSIDRKCVFNWARDNMKNPHSVFYDDARKAEFSAQAPKRPEEANMFQPFVSQKVLAQILVQMGFLKVDSSFDASVDKGQDAKASRPGAKKEQPPSNAADSKENDIFFTWLQTNGGVKPSSVGTLRSAGVTREKFVQMVKMDFLKLGLTAGQAIRAEKAARAAALI